MGADDLRHHGRVDDTQALDAAHAQLRVHHCHWSCTTPHVHDACCTSWRPSGYPHCRCQSRSDRGQLNAPLVTMTSRRARDLSHGASPQVLKPTALLSSYRRCAASSSAQPLTRAGVGDTDGASVAAMVSTGKRARNRPSRRRQSRDRTLQRRRVPSCEETARASPAFQWNDLPPSAASAAPVTYDDSALVRNRMARAISEGSANRLSA